MRSKDKHLVMKMIRNGTTDDLLDAGAILIEHELIENGWNAEAAVTEGVSFWAENNKRVIGISHLVLPVGNRKTKIKMPERFYFKPNLYYVVVQLIDKAGDADFYVLPPWATSSPKVFDVGTRHLYLDGGVEYWRECWHYLNENQYDRALLPSREGVG